MRRTQAYCTSCSHQVRLCVRVCLCVRLGLGLGLAVTVAFSLTCKIVGVC